MSESQMSSSRLEPKHAYCERPSQLSPIPELGLPSTVSLCSSADRGSMCEAEQRQMNKAGGVLESVSLVDPVNEGSRDSRDWQNAVVCAVVTLAAVALTWPIAESGVNDDWSYTKTALDLAQTGRFQYNGWAAAMLGVQACWGALFIKLFGFSFLAVRLSTVPLAAGCAVLAYKLHRCAGLPPRLSLFGSLTLALSPVFVPNAASFMTEIPGLFLFLASVYGYVGVAGVMSESGTAEDALVSARLRLWIWLGFALAAGMLAGTVRQVYWLVPILAPLYLCARGRLFRCAKSALPPLVLSVIVAFAGALAFSFWFSAQPYAIHEHVAEGLRSALRLQSLFSLMEFSIRIVLTLGVMALPIVIAIPGLFPKWLETNRQPRTCLLLGLLLTIILQFLAVSALGTKWLFPWLGNMFGRTPYLTGLAPTPYWTVPVTFPSIFWKCFSLCVTGLICGILVMTSLTRFRRRHKTGASLPSIQNLAACLGGAPAPLALLALFVIAYVPILLLKAVVPDSFGIFDRYLLPVLPGITLALLTMYHRDSKRDRLPYLAWSVLVLFTFYGIASTHDYFSQLRARLALTVQLEGRGIPRARIMGGFEYDSWTQITVAGHYNDPRIQKPDHCYTPPGSLAFDTIYTLWKYTPIVRPDYVVSLGRHRGLYDTDLPSVVFPCWLPPFRRELVVQTHERDLIYVKSFTPSPGRTAPGTSAAGALSPNTTRS
jgi:hypothetical protein